MRQSPFTFWFLVLFAAFVGMNSSSLHAESNTTNIIDGVFTNAGGPYSVGSSGPSNALIITNAGVLFSTIGIVGSNDFAGLNYAVVTGPGSKWISTSDFYIGKYGFNNHLLIANGGYVSNGVCAVGGKQGLNSISISGTSSEWVCGGAFYFGYSSSYNTFFITNGGHFQSTTSIISGDIQFFGGGTQPSGNTNRVVVSGQGSRWDNSAFLIVGQTGNNNQITIQNGGMGVWQSLGYGTVSQSPPSFNNSVLLSGGKLFITNQTHTGNVFMGESGQLLLVTNGLLVIDTFKNFGGTFNFASGAMTAGVMTNNPRLTIGNGKLPAVLTLLSNSHSFPNGVIISSNAILQAAGTIQGGVTNSGLLSIGSSPGKLTIRGNLNQQPAGSLTLRIGGLSQGTQYDFLNVTNIADLSGTLRISLVNNFIPNSNDVFTVMQFGSQAGAFANAANGGRLKTSDNLGSFQVDYIATTLQLSHFESTDTDGDGIEDAWANQFFGHSPLTSVEKDDDLDNDGVSNYSEFLAGTNPTNASSLFRLVAKQSEGNVALEFEAASDRRYQLDYSDDLITWSRIATPLFQNQGSGLSRWVDDGLQTGSLPPSGGRFYRAVVE